MFPHIHSFCERTGFISPRHLVVVPECLGNALWEDILIVAAFFFGLMVSVAQKQCDPIGPPFPFLLS